MVRRRRGGRHHVAAQGTPPLGWSSRTRSGADAPADIGAGRAPPPSPVSGHGRRRCRLVGSGVRSAGRGDPVAARPDPVSLRAGGLVRARGGPYPSTDPRARWPSARTTGSSAARLRHTLARTRRWRRAPRLDAGRSGTRSSALQRRRQPATAARSPEVVSLGPPRPAILRGCDYHSSSSRRFATIRPMSRCRRTACFSGLDTCANSGLGSTHCCRSESG